MHAPRPNPFEPGRVLGGYTLRRRFASGGMSELWMADGPDGRWAVIKRPTGALATTAEGRAAFLDEARLMRALDHASIVRALALFDVGDGTPALALEYVHGPSLRRMLGRLSERGYALESELGLTVVARALEALDHAHNARDPDTGAPLGIVHRDVTPANILVSVDGQVKLIDFGIAMAHARLAVTRAGFLKGSPHFMAPEAARGERPDRRTDVYSAGAVLYEVCTGQPPFGNATQIDVLMKLARGETPAEPRTLDASLSPQLEGLILQAMSPDPRQRFQSAAAMRRALESQLPRGLVRSSALAQTIDALFPEGLRVGAGADDAGSPNGPSAESLAIELAPGARPDAAAAIAHWRRRAA